MRTRCKNPNRNRWHVYGGRGVSVCKRWDVFANFAADMGPPPFEGASIDRIDNDADYGPDNCRWATAKEQNRNKRNNRLVTHDGQTLCITEWSERTGLSRRIIAARLNGGWPVDFALSAPAWKRWQPTAAGDKFVVTRNIPIGTGLWLN